MSQPWERSLHTDFSKDGSAGGHPRIESHGVGASEKALHLLPPTARQGDPHMLPWLAVSVGSLLLVGFAARGHRWADTAPQQQFRGEPGYRLHYFYIKYLGG